MDASRVDNRAIPTTQVSCNTCGSDQTRQITIGQDHEYPHTRTGEFPVVECENCGLVYLNPRPAISALDRIYPPDYYAYRLIEERAKSESASDSLLTRFFYFRNLRRYRRYTSLFDDIGQRVLRVLDIGCGDGTILGYWRDALGSAAETYGIEMDGFAAEMATKEGHRVTTSRIEDAELPQDFFDFVYSFHVIEHVEDPTTFMLKIHEAVKPDGYVLIDTPNLDCVDFKLLKSKHWGGYHFPRHWNLYTWQTFGALAKKTGYEIVDTSYYPNYPFWVWSFHSMLHCRSKRLADRLFHPVEVFYRASLWNFSLQVSFTLIEYFLLLTYRRLAAMRVLLRPIK